MASIDPALLYKNAGTFLVLVSANAAEVNGVKTLFTAENGWIIERCWIKVTTNFTVGAGAPLLYVGDDPVTNGLLHGVFGAPAAGQIGVDPVETGFNQPENQNGQGAYLWASGLPQSKSYDSGDANKVVKARNGGTGTFGVGACNMLFRILLT